MPPLFAQLLPPLFRSRVSPDVGRADPASGDWAGHYLVAGLLAAGLACSSPDFSGPGPAVDPNQAFRVLTLPAHAITMSTAAPYDTLQLIATARNAAGESLPDAPAPTYTTSDSSVRVSATGLLTARAVANDVRVIAAMVYQGVRLADTAVVTVTDEVAPPAFARLQLGPLPGDSAKLPTPVQFSNLYAPQRKTLVAVAEDGFGQPISGAQVALRTSAPTYATIPATTSTGQARVVFSPIASRPGPVWVYASATVYGVTHTDSLELTLTNPVLQVYTLVPGPGGSGVTFARAGTTAVLGASGVVWWINNTPGDTLDVVFDDPSAATAAPSLFPDPQTTDGNIPAFSGCTDGACANTRTRRFLQVGTYDWHSPKTGLSGRIIVQ